MKGKPSLHTPDIFEPPKTHHHLGKENTGLSPREPGNTQIKKSGDEKQAKNKKTLPTKVFPSPPLPITSIPRLRNVQAQDANLQDLNNIRSILKKSSPAVKEESPVKSNVKKAEISGKVKRRRKTADETNTTEEVHADGDGERKLSNVENKLDARPIIIETRRGKAICPNSLIAAASSVANSIMRLAQSPTISPTWDTNNKVEKPRPPSKVEEKDRGEEKEETVESRVASATLERRRGKPKKKLLKEGEVESFANSENPTVKNAWPLHCAFLAALQECSPRLIPALSANNEAAFLNAMWSCFWRGYRAGFQASMRELEASIAGKCDLSNKKPNANSTTNKPGEVAEKPSSKT